MADAKVAEAGFEYQGVFYPWHITTTGSDLLLIDRICGMSAQDFFELIEDNYDMSRSSVLLTLIATSLRNRHPERSLERIYRTVMALSLDDVEFMSGEDEEDEVLPPAEAGADPAEDLSASSSETQNGSQAQTSESSYATPV